MTETKDQKALRFKKLCISILAQSGNCKESQHDFNDTHTISQMCSAWWKYWHGLITEVPQQVVKAFEDFYPDFKDEINAAGFYYNEDSPNGIVLVGNSNNVIHLSQSHRITVLGKAHVVLHLSATALVLNPDCKVDLHDTSRATVKQGYAIAHDYSQLTTFCDAECYNQSVVHITNSTLNDKGHRAIYAYGSATINSFTTRLITLYDNSKLNV